MAGPLRKMTVLRYFLFIFFSPYNIISIEARLGFNGI